MEHATLRTANFYRENVKTCNVRLNTTKQQFAQISLQQCQRLESVEYFRKIIFLTKCTFVLNYIKKFGTTSYKYTFSRICFEYFYFRYISKIMKMVNLQEKVMKHYFLSLL